MVGFFVTDMKWIQHMSGGNSKSYSCQTCWPESSLSAAIRALWIFFGMIRPSSPTIDWSLPASRSTNSTSVSQAPHIKTITHLFGFSLENLCFHCQRIQNSVRPVDSHVASQKACWLAMIRHSAGENSTTCYKTIIIWTAAAAYDNFWSFIYHLLTYLFHKAFDMRHNNH